MAEPVVLTCLGCGRRVTTTHLPVEDLRALTGYRVLEGEDWCGECAAALRANATLIDELSSRPASTS
jgi:hypothetical protein